MKNLKNFSELNENVNEGGKIDISEDVQAAYADLNVLNLLMDEGHFDDHGFPKSDLEDVNACIEEAGLGPEGGFFKSESDMDKFTTTVKETLFVG